MATRPPTPFEGDRPPAITARASSSPITRLAKSQDRVTLSLGGFFFVRLQLLLDNHREK